MKSIFFSYSYFDFDMKVVPKICLYILYLNVSDLRRGHNFPKYISWLKINNFRATSLPNKCQIIQHIFPSSILRL